MFWRNKRKIDFSWVSSDSRRCQKVALNTFLSKMKVKIENDFKELKKSGRHIWRHQRWLMPVCVELVTPLSERRVRLFKTVFKAARKVTSTVSHKCAHVLFTYWIVYRLAVILNAKAKLVLVWARFCLCAWPAFIYSCHGITDTYIAVVVTKLYFKAAAGICSTKTSLKTSCLL